MFFFKKRKIKSFLKGYALSFFLTTIFTLFYFFGGFARLSLIYYDFYFYLRGSVSPDPRIVIVAQDDESIEHFNIRASDWPRTLHAKLIKSLDLAGAELIVFDYDFSKPATPEEDRAFAKAIEEAQNVILAIRMLPNGEIVHPLPAFAENALDEGMIIFDPDMDSHWRRISYLAKEKGKENYYVSLSLKVVEIYEDFPEEQRDIYHKDYLKWGPYKLPYPDMLINFSGPAKTIPFLSYYKVINGDIPPKAIKEKIVFVGNTYSLGKDFFSTPTARPMTGVEVHASAVATILNKTFILPVSQRGMLVLMIGLGVLVGLFFFHPQINVRLNLIIVFTMLIFLNMTGYYLFAYKLMWLDAVPLMTVLVGNAAAGGIYQLAVTRKHKAMIKEVFGKYLSKNVAETILSDDIPIKMDGHKAELTVLFSDIREFTNLSEKLSPMEVGELLNKYFEEMIQIVFTFNGTLDKLMGDAVMAFFGAPISFSDHPAKACRCALKMISSLKKRNKKQMNKMTDEINIGIGVNTGEVIVGNLGSSQYIDYTVIGDTVNLGSRLESLNKQYKTEIIIGEVTFACVKEEFVCREIDLVTVKGKTKPIKIYELLGEKTDFNQNSLGFLKDFQEGLYLYRAQLWKEAIECFQSVLIAKPGDRVSDIFIRRCKEFLNHPPPVNWSGVYEMKTK